MIDGLVITGTDTGVGKTWVGVQLIAALRAQGLAVCPKKPVESGLAACASEEESDAGRLAAAAAVPLEAVAQYRLAEPVAPPVAARREQISYTLADCVAACAHSEGLAVVEGAGGWRSPLAADGDVRDLAAQLAYPVLVVAADRLGAINHTLLTCADVVQTNPLLGVILNRQDATNTCANAESLRAHLAVPVWCTGPDVWLDTADEQALLTAIYGED